MEIKKSLKKKYFHSNSQYQAYMEEYIELYVRSIYKGIIISIIFYNIFLSLDYIIYPEYFFKLFLIRLFFNILAFFLLGVYLGNKNFVYRHYQLIGTIWVILIEAPIALMIYITEGSVSPYYTGLLLSIITSCQFLPCTFKESVKYCLIIVFSYLTVIFLHHDIPFSYKLFYNNFLFIITTSFLNVMICYILNELRIKEFLQRNKLKKAIIQVEKTEFQLIHSEKMRALGVFTAGILHEINNPLNFMNTAIKFLQKKNENYNKDSCDMIAIINDGVERISDITEKLRRFSSGANQKKSKFSIKKLIEDIKKLVNNKLEGITVSYNIENNYIFGYSVDIFQVFLNLFSNAFHALQNVKQPKIIISTSKKDNRLFIKFRDNGIGIAEENLSKIFDPFFTTKNIEDGTGLGLSICYKIIENHGGTLMINSKEGKWTEFVFDLPLQKEEECLQ